MPTAICTDETAIAPYSSMLPSTSDLLCRDVPGRTSTIDVLPNYSGKPALLLDIPPETRPMLQRLSTPKPSTVNTSTENSVAGSARFSRSAGAVVKLSTFTRHVLRQLDPETSLHWSQKNRIRSWLLEHGFPVGYLDKEAGRTGFEVIGNMVDNTSPKYEAETELSCYWPGVLSHVDID